MTRTSNAVTIEAACPADDPQIRALLRSGAMEGPITISLEREPTAALADTIAGDRHYTLVAREQGTGRIRAMGTRSVRVLWVNGEPRRVGYLGELRTTGQGLIPRRRLLQEGYSALEATRRGDELPFDLTSIVATNARSRRLLEASLPGMPTYEPLFELTTQVVPVLRGIRSQLPWSPRASRVRTFRAAAADLPVVAGLLQSALSPYQFAPVWTEGDLLSGEVTRGLAPDDVLLVEEGGALAASAAIWDQRAFKQAVIRRYRPALAAARPLLNIGLRVAGLPGFPPEGAALAMAYLSHLAVRPGRDDLLLSIASSALRAGAAAGFDYLVTGFAASDPVARRFRRAFGGYRYDSVIYAVHWGAASVRRQLDRRLPRLEVAVL